MASLSRLSLQCLALVLAVSLTQAQLSILGARVLSYLHARGDALDITTPSPIKAIYINLRDATDPPSAVVAAVDAGFNVVLLA